MNAGMDGSNGSSVQHQRAMSHHPIIRTALLGTGAAGVRSMLIAGQSPRVRHEE
jgi:hypothetical protein